MSRLENTIPGFKTLLIEPYTPVIGATVRNIDLNDLKDESTKNELRKALAEFQVLFFREQKLSPDQLIEVAKVFGDPDKAKAFFPRHELHKAIEVLESKSHKFKNYTDQWHADISFSKNPPTGTALYSYIVPNLGGDTVWSSTSAAYESLAIPLQTYLESLVAVHSFENSGWPEYFEQLSEGESLYRKARGENIPVEHPVVRVHPITKKKILYVSPTFTDRIKGLPRQESDALLGFLFARIERPEFQARLRWEKNTLAIWDNRATVHYAVTDYGDQHRLLHRVTFGEDIAF